MKNWKYTSKENLGFANQISEFIGKIENNRSIELPDLRQSKSLFVFSDYGGEHKSTKFNTYSFLIIDVESVGFFYEKYIEFNKERDLYGRVIEFKRLNDKIRSDNLIPFLSLADNLNGIVFNIVVEKKINTLFEKIDIIPLEYQIWKKKTFEKLLRVCHLLSILVNGLSKEFQDVCWITDEDNIVANNEQLTLLTTLFANTCSYYLDHDLRHFRLGRANIEINKNFEYLCAIPDLVSGGLNEVLDSHLNQNVFPITDIVIPTPKETKLKAKTIVSWLIDNSKSQLKKVSILISDCNENGFKISHLKFHNMSQVIINNHL